MVSSAGVLVVVARGERRLHIAAQRNGDQLRGIRIGPGVVEAAIDRIELAIGRIEEILAFRLERRLRVVEIAGRRLMQLGGLRVVEEIALLPGLVGRA